MSDPPLLPKRWRKPALLTFTLAVVITVVALAHEVMFPFVMALVLAYVLTPAVAWVERRKVKRGLAIVIVYVVVLGSLAGFIRLAAPRIGQELGSLGREAKLVTMRCSGARTRYKKQRRPHRPTARGRRPTRSPSSRT